MPTIAKFYGITVMMYPRNNEHNPPHLHARYGEYEGLFLISTGEILDNTMPKKAQILVKEFIDYYRDDLMEMWNSHNIKKLDPID